MRNDKQDDSDESGRRGDRRGIQSVEIGVRVIEALRTSDGPLTLSELARRSGVPASNCHRYLVSFTRTGFIVQNPLTTRYDFGPALLQAGLAAMSRLDPIQIGNEALAELVQRTEKSALLAVWTDRGAVIVRWLSGREVVRTNLSIGSTMPLLTSATGSVFLAYLPRLQTKDIADREHKAGAEDPNKIVERVRATGLGQVIDRHIPGLSAASAPILDNNGEAAAALSLVGLTGGLLDKDFDELRAVAADASYRLGYNLDQEKRN
jgi:DNA-binding IclR family transcriptional regulator